MVTAGVYLITRSNAVFAESLAASTAVVVVGTVTLLVGAWIGCAKDDIKRVLAGSTMSQIGYMMLAAGIGRPATRTRSSSCSPMASSRPTCSWGRFGDHTPMTRSTCDVMAHCHGQCRSPS